MGVCLPAPEINPFEDALGNSARNYKQAFRQAGRRVESLPLFRGQRERPGIALDQMTQPLMKIQEGTRVVGVAMRVQLLRDRSIQSILSLIENSDDPHLWRSAWSSGQNLEDEFVSQHLSEISREERQAHEENPFYSCAHCPSTDSNANVDVIRSILAGTSQVVELV